MGSVIIVLKRQFLQMGKQIFADIVDNALAHFYHNPGTHGGEKHADCKCTHQHQHQSHQHMYIFIGDRLVQRFLRQHGAKQSRDAADGAQNEGKKHPSAVFFDINRSPE